jgi:proteasome lid subunit RPN8/RPN11
MRATAPRWITAGLAYPVRVRMTASQHEALVAHAREEAPNECCGFVRARDGVVRDIVQAVNDRASPYGYSLDAKSLLSAFNAAEEGFEVGIYHSHPRSPAEPSQTDINLADYPEYVYLIVSLADPDSPDVRAWRIADKRVSEEAIVVE